MVLDPLVQLQQFFDSFIGFEPGETKFVIQYGEEMIVLEIDENQMGVQFGEQFALLATRTLFEVVDSKYFYETVRIEDATLQALPSDLGAFIFSCFGSPQALKIVNKCSID